MNIPCPKCHVEEGDFHREWCPEIYELDAEARAKIAKHHANKPRKMSVMQALSILANYGRNPA